MSLNAEQKNLLISSIEWRAECKKRAYRTVLSLIESNITPDQLIKSAPTLDPAHYEDVVEERHLGHLCGYPLCDNPVTKGSQQKFHISVKDKKVYDLSERKQFCCGWCYKASQYFASQLSTIPLWARQNEVLPTIELLSKNDTSGKVNSKSAASSKPGIHKDEATTSAPSVEQSATSLEHLHISSDEGQVHNNAKQLSSETVVKTDDASITPRSDKDNAQPNAIGLDTPSNKNPRSPTRHKMEEANGKAIDDGSKVNIGPKHYGAPVQKLSPREKVMSALLQWKTSETVRFLAGSLPDYGKDDVDNKSNSNYLPTVDSHNQMSLRRKIVIQQLMKGLSPILNRVGLTTLQVSGDIVTMVTTFNLQPNNISFQPSLWTAVAAILLLLICKINKELASVINFDNMLPFVGKAGMSENDVTKCLEAFESP